MIKNYFSLFKSLLRNQTQASESQDTLSMSLSYGNDRECGPRDEEHFCNNGQEGGILDHQAEPVPEAKTGKGKLSQNQNWSNAFSHS